jgi:putative glutamine amidotransferase
MKKKKIAITYDPGMDQRLISIIAELHDIELVWIAREMSAENNKEELFESKKISHLLYVKNAMQDVDGLVLPGNKYDINPRHYGINRMHLETRKKINLIKNDIRFDVEKTMLLCAMERKLPIVAICAGMQLVNVVLGGSLVQNVADHSDGVIHKSPIRLEKEIKYNFEHEFESDILTGKIKNIFSEQAHPVKIAKNSALGKIYKKYIPDIDLENVLELSLHHQGYFKENLASGLKVIATSSDGLVEAVELIDYPSLFIATQFHFEYNVGNIASGIFKELTL